VRGPAAHGLAQSSHLARPDWLSRSTALPNSLSSTIGTEISHCTAFAPSLRLAPQCAHCNVNGIVEQFRVRITPASSPAAPLAQMPPAGKRPPTVGAAPRQTAAAAAWRQTALLLNCQLVPGPLPAAAARAAAPAAATAAARPCCNITEKETFQHHDCTSLPLPQASVTGHGSMGRTGIDPAYKRSCVYQMKTC